MRARHGLERLEVDLEQRKPTGKRGRWPDPRDDRERRLMAEAAFHQGRSNLRAEQAARALPGLHRAFELCPDEREYALHVKWAQILVNDTFRDEAARHEIQALAAELVSVERSSELGFSILGYCAMHDGKEADALRFFRRAVTLDTTLVEANMLARELAARVVTEPRRRGPSISDSQKRAKARGLSRSPLDAIVPLLLDTTTEAPRTSVPTSPSLEPAAPPKTPSQVVLPGRGNVPSPDGTLDGVPPPEETAPMVAKAASTETTPAQEKAATAETASIAEEKPSTAASSPPPAQPLPVTVTQPLVPQRPPVAALRPPSASTAPAPATHPRTRAPSPSRDHLPAEGPRRRRTALLAGWMASLTLTATAAYVFGSRTLFEPEPAVTTTEGARTLSSAATETKTETETSGPALASASSTAAASSASSAVPEAATPLAAADGGAPAKTAILKTPKGLGRRIFVDGRVIGEGGREHTIACGRHRIRVGSAGVERAVMVPCGGTIELD